MGEKKAENWDQSYSSNLTKCYQADDIEQEKKKMHEFIKQISIERQKAL